MTIERRVTQLEQVASEPSRLAAECRARTNGIVRRLLADGGTAQGFELEAIAFGLADAHDAPPASLTDAERIALHDRVRQAFDLPPIGELP